MDFEDEARFERVGDLVAGKDDGREDEELSVGGVSGAEEAREGRDERAKHVGKSVVLLVDGDSGRVGDLGVFLDSEPGGARSARVRRREGEVKSLGLALGEDKELEPTGGVHRVRVLGSVRQGSQHACSEENCRVEEARSVVSYAVSSSPLPRKEKGSGD